MNPIHDIEWIDSGREPQCPPNPDCPEGIDVDATGYEGKSCSVTLPYPAKRCGVWHIRCQDCGRAIAITAAGRPDDPRSVRFNCNWDDVGKGIVP